MEINEFIENFAELFDDTELSEIQTDTEFHALEEWSSIIGMGVIALAKTRYGKTVTGAEIRACVTVDDLFNLIKSK